MNWTSGLDWRTDIFCAKNHFCALMGSHSPVGLDMMHFSLYKPGHTILSV